MIVLEIHSCIESEEQSIISGHIQKFESGNFWMCPVIEELFHTRLYSTGDNIFARRIPKMTYVPVNI